MKIGIADPADLYDNALYKSTYLIAYLLTLYLLATK